MRIFEFKDAYLSYSDISYSNCFSAFFPEVEGGILRARRSAPDSLGVAFGACAMTTSILLFVRNPHSGIRHAGQLPLRKRIHCRHMQLRQEF